MKKLLPYAVCAWLIPALTLNAQHVNRPATIQNATIISDRSGTAQIDNSGNQDAQMVNCTDVVNYVDRNSSASVVAGWLGGASGFGSFYQVYPDFTGTVTEVYVHAKKRGTANCPINITVHALDVNGDPIFNNVGSTFTTTVTATGYTQYGGALTSAPTVTNGFAVCVWVGVMSDSCDIRTKTDADMRDLSYYDMGTAGSIGSMSSLGYDLDISLRPKIQFTAPTLTASANPSTACVGTSVSFSEGASTFPNHYTFNNWCDVIYNLGNITPTYSWGFGDAGTSTLSSPSHSYASTGNYTASVTTTYTGWTTSCVTAPGTTTVTVTGVVPSVSINATNTMVCTPDQVTFQATPTNGGTSPTYVWKKNGIQVGTGVTYTGTGWAYGDQITCEMTSNASCASPLLATSSPIYMALYPGSTSAFTYTTNNLNASFTEQASNEVSYLWDYGDSQTGTAPSPVHTYAAAGVYSVQLTTTNQCGATNSSFINITVLTNGNTSGGNVGIEEHTGTIAASSYPNPAGNSLNVSYSLEQTADLNIEVMNNLGQVVSTQVVQNASTGVATISMEGLAAGMYFVKLSDGTSQTVMSVAHE